MEETLEPLEETDHPARASKHLVLGLAASVLLHVTCSVIILGLPGGGHPPRPAVTYVDLKTIPAPEPVATPAPKAAPQPEPEPIPDPSEAKPLPVPEPPPAAAEAKPQALQPLPQQNAVQQQAEDLSHTSFGLGLTKGFFKTLSDGDTLRPDIKAYYLDLLQGVNEKWWLEQKDQKVRTIVVNITVARNGEIVGSFILESSGNIVYDRAVQKTLEGAGPLPPLPPSFQGEFFNAPIRLVPPLNLMSW